MIRLCTLLLLFTSSLIFAQDYTITGTVKEKESQQLLESATIYAESIKDSTLISYTISENNGGFQLDFKTSEPKVNVFFTYNGYKSVMKEFVLNKPKFEVGDILLQPQLQELDGVSVVGERIPITIKKDTLEFNADSFKTRPDATVEDVLKKLPGVEIDSEGKITVNGKEVNQVLVNGQVFFSNDPKVATKSLPKEIISKIQITDTKTKTQEFAGEEGNGETKTINLTIKEDKNKGMMGRLSAGYGTDDRYQLNGLLNYFNNKERVSILTGANNINNAGFSFDEIYDMVGNTSRGISFNSNGAFSVGGMSFGFGQGIVTTSNLGASYANAKKGKYELDANYFFTSSDSYNDQRTNRENFLPDGSFFTNSESNFEGTTKSHRGAANLEFDIDETLRISVQPAMSVNNTDSENISATESISDQDELINRNRSRTVSNGEQRNFSNQLNIFKKLDTIGRYIRFGFSNNNTENMNVSNFYTRREVFGDNPSDEELDQKTFTNATTDSYNLGFTYNHPLSKKTFVSLGYNFRNAMNKNEKSVFDYDEVSQVYDDFNTLLSSDFNFENKQHYPEAGFRRNGEKFRFGLSARYFFTELDNEDFLQSTTFNNKYENLLFTANANYSFDKRKRMSLWYYSDLNMPSVRQLQPVPDVSNPLNVVIGNPDLNPSTNHSLSLSFNNYNWQERTGMFFHASLRAETDKIVAVTTTDEDFIRTTEYRNIDGNYSIYGSARYSKQFKKDSTFTAKINIKPYFNYNKGVSFSNGQQLESNSYSITPRISTTLNFLEMLELEPGYEFGYTDTRYNLSAVDDINFVTQRATLKTTTYWPKNLIWGNDISYTYNSNVGPGFDKDALFWNMSLGMQMFKEKATLKVLAYDLLNQNNNTRRSTGTDYIQDFQGTVLQRYFMMSFTFKFDQFGGKKKKSSMMYLD
ncbi:outer membrane beta-barrel protein [Zhouia amylolytica]|uniref:Outer membrane protein beta-barrel domain-containing protein n=1 Tax=Zhouia amylolytica AD3 TaxID=1286632 RepID=W2UKR0_9FLAO|nr:outer membrane beta-barrel protein [Zhouia amylolytica]ETN93907.1 hypothetical protein P278_33180 [Zhouia amylolytica AD3]